LFRSRLGVIILADRVSGIRYTGEEMDLLKCIGDQVGVSLLNLRLTKKIMLGKELEAFQTMSAFFIHDLKNTASTLSLMLQNLPIHFDDAGRIMVETRQRNGWVTLSIADNGCGMTPAFVKNSLFRPFSTTKKKGLGIGMFHAKMIVEAHRGNIQVKSELGSGTTFEVMLPLKSPAE